MGIDAGSKRSHGIEAYCRSQGWLRFGLDKKDPRPLPFGAAATLRVNLPTSITRVSLGSPRVGWEAAAVLDHHFGRLLLAANLGFRGSAPTELENVALEWAAEINSKSPTAMRMLKFGFNLPDDGLVGQQLFAGEATRLAYGTDEAVEGREAFLEKRKRDFSKFPWHY